MFLDSFFATDFNWLLENTGMSQQTDVNDWLTESSDCMLIILATILVSIIVYQVTPWIL